MSLINDALKKAARQRAEEQADVVAPMPGGGRRISRQGAPMRTQTMVLIGAAALALIIVSAVVTGIFLTGKPEAKPAEPSPAAPTRAPTPKIVVEAPPVAVSLPRLGAPAPVAAAVAPAISHVAPAAAPVAQAAPSPAPQTIQAPAPVVQAAAPAAQTQPPAGASTPATQSHTDLIQGVIDGYHISGVRLAGAGSKALIDGHVYKLNDVVDRALGLRLVKVDEDHLTFADRDGNTFAKTF